jgi:pilus assembly protein CpaB
MSDRRYTAIFGVAVLTAAAATFSVYRVLSAASTPRREPTRAVVVVARDVPAGVPVPREALASVPWPTRVAPSESFDAADSVVGRVTRAPLTRGEPVLASALAPHGAAPGLEGTIAPGHRAMAVRVHEATGMSGLVRPNGRVDVLVTGVDATGVRTARPIMSDVRVLGVGSVRPAEGAAPAGGEVAPNVASIVTLEVTPAQAQQLAAAEGQGAIQVVLRGYGSTDDASPPGPTAAVSPPAPGDADGGRRSRRARDAHALRAAARRVPAVPTTVAATAAPPAPPAAPARPDSATVRVYRAGQATDVRVESGADRPAPAPRSAELRTAAGAP